MGDIKSDMLVRLALKNGLVDELKMNEVLRERVELERKGEKPPKLGDMLVARGLIDFAEARALLKRNSMRKRVANPVDIVGMRLDKEYEEFAAGELSFEAENDPGSTQRREKQARFEDYRIIQRLGADAAGTTYQAVYMPDQSRVSLRILSLRITQDDPELADSFVKSIKRAHKLKHPNIQQILRGARKQKRLFYAAEYAPGHSLRKELVEHTRLSPKVTLDIALQVAKALEYAHGKQIYHTQLEPSKIILGPDGKIKIVGFGLAGNVVRNLEWLADSLGDMPYYVAPEMAVAGGAPANIGPATDIFSLGAVMFHCVAGEPPFSGNSLDEVFLDMYECEDLRGRLTSSGKVPPELAELILQMLNPEPKKRVASAKVLVDSLKKIVSAILRAEERATRSATAIHAAVAQQAVSKTGSHRPVRAPRWSAEPAPVAAAPAPAAGRNKGRVYQRLFKRKLKEKGGESSAIKTFFTYLLVLGGLAAIIYGMASSMQSGADAQNKHIQQRVDEPIKSLLQNLDKAADKALQDTGAQKPKGGTPEKK